MGTKGRARRGGWLLAVAAGVLALGLAPGLAGAATRVTMKGGQVGGAYERWVSAWSLFLTQNVPGLQVSAEASTGSPENVRRLDAGTVEFGLAFASDIYEAWNAQGKFKTKLRNLRSMSYLFASVGHFVVLAESPIGKVEDIAGKTVALGGPGSGSALAFERLAQQMGLRGKFKAVYLGGTKASDALKNGQVDGYNWHPNIGNATFHHTASTHKIRFINMDEPARKSGFYKKYPFYGPMKVPAGVYRGVTVDTPTFGTGSILLSQKGVPADVVYRVLKGIWSEAGRKYLRQAAGKVAEEMTEKAALQLLTVPLHPGAERFWKEKGKQIPAALKAM